MSDSERARYSVGVMARFDSAEALKSACQSMADRGISGIMAHLPHPIEGIEAWTHSERVPVARLALFSGIAMGLLCYAFLHGSSVIAYPYQVGGRPTHSWPSFVPLCFELIILAAAAASFLAATYGNGMPKFWRPFFTFSGFERASQTEYLLWVPLSESEERVEAIEAALIERGAKSTEVRNGG